ncbi:GNAT family N-acetyltransferase [Pseudooceanicola sp.]|uniref:GNAT family N-acetyltransferase n=1 Tax=Pseudooceanicola sp. TaxID=1914328 RepID=UPI002628BE9C|nr:GNAT family N-acetyltransferase [Pseudooceanicola sp.]MDF1856170.1 GNAT family N-acetyltransferase [Pseudooceanicola sp.]
MIRLKEAPDLTAPHALRRAVFIVEQGIAEDEEWDDLDAGARHILARDGDTPVGTARLIVDGSTGRITRVCVLDSHRGPGLTRAELSAQVQARGFYEALGFVAEGPDYDDAGIPHVTMTRTLGQTDNG